MLTYIKIFVDYLDAIEPLGDKERGRLFTALLEYGRTGAVPQLSGNERFVFPMMKAQIDRDNAAFAETSERRSEAGKLGGRPKSNEKQTKAKKAIAFSESKKSQDKEKEKEKDEDEEEDKEKDEDIYITTTTTAQACTHTARVREPTFTEVAYYFEHETMMLLDAVRKEAEKFCAYNAMRHWDCLPDWKLAADLWAARCERDSIDALFDGYDSYCVSGSGRKGEET